MARAPCRRCRRGSFAHCRLTMSALSLRHLARTGRRQPARRLTLAGRSVSVPSNAFAVEGQGSPSRRCGTLPVRRGKADRAHDR
jgi:hypothetical protein